jgi:dihydrofolate reductase
VLEYPHDPLYLCVGTGTLEATKSPMKVWLIAAMSVDGKIAERADQTSLDWTSKDDLRFFVEKTKEAGTVIMGRKTFATIGRPLKDRRLIVMTEDPSAQEAMLGVEYVNNSAKGIIEKLHAEGCEAVVIAGGAYVYGEFIAENLVTDFFLTIEPVLFGGGIPLVRDAIRSDLRFVDSRMLNDQTILLHYTAL